MSYRLRTRESAAAGIGRIVIEQMDQALRQVRSVPKPANETIHKVRVCFKRIRAALRLIRDDLGPELFELENFAFRDAARHLAPTRDAAVLVHTLRKLAERFPSGVGGRQHQRLRRLLRKRLPGDGRALLQALPAVEEKLIGARLLIADWLAHQSVQRDDFAALGNGLKRAYASGCKCLEAARQQPDAAVLHEWRKQVKYLLYQLSILTPVWPEHLCGLSVELKKLAACLNDDHDLDVLREALLQTLRPKNDKDIRSVLSLIERCRAELRQTAWHLGVRIYAENPGSFVRRLRVYWEQWRSEAIGTVSFADDVAAVAVRLPTPLLTVAGANQSRNRSPDEQRCLSVAAGR